MNQKRYRFFGGLLSAQENWLNRMARRGLRLVRTSRLLYEFEPCQPGQVCYKVEFIGHKSHASALDYRNFLESMGYQVFFKNINLNYSVGKVCWRPWAEKGGRIARTSTTFNRELLIIEKENDGTPFALHTTYEDRRNYCKALRNPILFLFIASAVLWAVTRTWVWGLFALLSLIPLAGYQMELHRLKRQADISEW